MGRFRMNMFAVAYDFEDYGGLLKCEEAEVQCQYNQYNWMVESCWIRGSLDLKFLCPNFIKFLWHFETLQSWHNARGHGFHMLHYVTLQAFDLSNPWMDLVQQNKNKAAKARWHFVYDTSDKVRDTGEQNRSFFHPSRTPSASLRLFNSILEGNIQDACETRLQTSASSS